MGQINPTDLFGKGRFMGPTAGTRKMTNVVTKRLASLGVAMSDLRSGRRTTRSRDEAGAILILALVFLVAVGGVVGSLASWATNDLHSTTAFTTARTLQYAESGAVDTAMQNIRYTPQLSSTWNQQADEGANPPVPCWGTASSSGVSINGYNVDVWCSTTWNPGSASTRVVTFSACRVVGPQSGQSCATNPDLEAVVTYGDYPAGTSAPNTAECIVYCGTSMTVNSWIWTP
jgi:hypothetical protein